MDCPVVRMLMAPVTRQFATLPTAKSPRAWVHAGISARRSKPFTVERLKQVPGTVGQTGVGGAGAVVGHKAGSVIVVVVTVGVVLKAPWRHPKMDNPVVALVMEFRARQTAAAPEL